MPVHVNARTGASALLSVTAAAARLHAIPEARVAVLPQGPLHDSGTWLETRAGGSREHADGGVRAPPAIAFSFAFSLKFLKT